jgi:hypothetical protein
VSDSVFMPDALHAEAEAVGLRLRACVHEAIERCFGDVPSARELTDATGIDGVVCKRLVKLLREGPGQTVLTHAPSVVNLRDFASVLEQHHGLGPLEAFALRDAAAKYEKLIKAFGGTKGDLTKALRAHDDGQTLVTQGARPLAFGTLLEGVVSDEHGAPVAALTELNPLAHEPDDLADALCAAAAGGRVITWSGTLADELFARDPSVWSGEGMDALGRLCRAVAPKLKAAGVRWLLRPHCRHVLCDTQRTVNFLRGQISAHSLRESVGLALDPCGLLESSMLSASGGGGATPSDFIGSAIRTLGPVSDALLLSGLLAPEQRSDEEFENVPLPERCSIDDGLIDLAEQCEPLRSVRPFLGLLVPLVGDAPTQISLLRRSLSPEETA